MGTCPKCGNTVTNVRIGDIDVIAGPYDRWRGIKYVCPSCDCVLSVAIDPVALKTEVVEEILDILRRH